MCQGAGWKHSETDSQAPPYLEQNCEMALHLWHATDLKKKQYRMRVSQNVPCHCAEFTLLWECIVTVQGHYSFTPLL